MPLIQNFSVPAGDDEVIEVDITGVNLEGASIEWCVYAQNNGVPVASPILIEKTSPSEIEIVESPASVLITLSGADTHGLTDGVYYHELTVVDALHSRSTVTTGLLTVTLTENP